MQLLSRKGTTAKVIFIAIRALFLESAMFLCLYSSYANPVLSFRAYANSTEYNIILVICIFPD